MKLTLFILYSNAGCRQSATCFDRLWCHFQAVFYKENVWAIHLSCGAYFSSLNMNIKVHSLHMLLVTQDLKMTARTVETRSRLPTTCSNIYIYI